MKRRVSFTAAGLMCLIAALSLSGCASTSKTEMADVELVKEGILHRAELLNQGDAEALIEYWDENGVRMAPNRSPVIGIEALAEATRNNLSRMDFEGRVHRIQEVEVSGDWAYSWGYYSNEQTPKAGGDTVKYYGKWLTIHHKQPDGSWKKYIDASNDEPAPK